MTCRRKSCSWEWVAARVAISLHVRKANNSKANNASHVSMWKRECVLTLITPLIPPPPALPHLFFSELQFAACLHCRRGLRAMQPKPPPPFLIARAVFILTVGTKKNASSCTSFFLKKKDLYVLLLTTSLQFTLLICNWCRGCLYLRRSS